MMFVRNISQFPMIHSMSFNLSTQSMWGTTVGELLCILSNITEYDIFY
jgi:hypothetical protein